MAELRPVTIGIIGTGEIAHDLVCDVLNDQFSLGKPDEEGYFAPSEMYKINVLIPAGEGTGEGVENVWQWVMRCELPFKLLRDGSDSKIITTIRESLESPDDQVQVTSVPTGLYAYLQGAENPMLLVLTTDGALDEDAAWLAAQCLTHDIPVYDLTRALFQLDWRDLPEGYEAPPVIEEESSGQLALVVDEGPDTVLTRAEAAAVQAALSQADEVMDTLRLTFDQRIPEVSQSLVAARAILAPKPTSTEKTTKAYMEIFNPESGQWERAGRGRPKKGVQTRLVPRG
jgi:hypothetical protein